MDWAIEQQSETLEAVPAKGHNYGDWIDEAPASCIATGTKGHYRCSYCNIDFDDQKQTLKDLTIAIDENAHDYGDWSQLSNSSTHKRVCKNDSTHTETANCSGGEATCRNKAKCDYCKSSYGELADHAYVWVVSGEEEHYRKCSTWLCTEQEAPESHTFDGDVCTICGGYDTRGTERVKYVYNSNGYYDVSGYSGTATEVTVAKYRYNENEKRFYPVQWIKNRAFQNQTITKITLSEGLKYIASLAFSGCTQLTSVTMPTTLKTIDTYVFSGCTALTGIVIPEGVTEIYKYALYRSYDITSIVIPTSVTKIGEWALAEGRLLKKLTYAGTQEDWSKVTCDTYWGSLDVIFKTESST